MFAALGLLLTAVTWIAGAYLVRTWRGTYKMSISQHAASARGASKIFTVTLVLIGGVFYIWLVGWFVPHLELGSVSVALLSVTVTLQFISGLIPDSYGWRKIVHRATAYTMAGLYIPLTYLIVSSDQLTAAAQYVSAVCITYMAVATFLFIFAKWAKNYYLIFQSFYIVAFQLIILSAAYLK